MSTISLIAKRAGVIGAMWTNRRFHRRVPVVAYFYPTYHCNLRCIYCLVDHSKQPPEMTTPQILRMVDELRDMGTRMISFLGGEPLVKKDIDVIIDHIQARGLLCDMTTNGTLIQQRLDVVKRLDAICVSLDGDREANDATRGPGTYDRILEGIRAATAAGVGVRVNCVITQFNREKFMHVLELGKEMRFPVTFGMPFEADLRHMLLSDEEAHEFFLNLKTLKRRGYPVVFSDRTIEYMSQYPLRQDEMINRAELDSYSPPLKPVYRAECPYGRSIVYIHCDGTVLPCNNLYKLRRPGTNFLEVGLKAAWEAYEDLPCFNCYEGGAPEWVNFTSIGGMMHGLRLTMKQSLRL